MRQREVPNHRDKVSLLKREIKRKEKQDPHGYLDNKRPDCEVRLSQKTDEEPKEKTPQDI